MIKFDARQTISRDLLSRLATAAGTSVDSILRSINSEVTPPFSLSASSTPNLIVSVGANKVSNAENGARHSNSFINKQYPTFTSGSITLPAASGSTITVTPTIITAPTLTLSAGQFVLGLIECDSLGNLSISLGTAAASEALAGVPGINKKALQIGLIVITNTGGVIDAITSAKIIQFSGAGGSGSASASGSGTGDDLASLMFKASFTDNLDDLPTDSTSGIDYTTGKTSSALYDSANELIRFSYDASKTVTGTGTAMTMSAAPSFTVVVGNILRVGTQARRITAVASQTSYTIELAFTTNPTAAAANVSQAIYTKDIYNAAIDGVSLYSINGSTISEIMVRYDDTTTLSDSISDFNTTPVVAFTASSDGSTFSAVTVRSTNLTDTATTLTLPTTTAGLYLRFFSNATSGSGSVNLLGYKTYLLKDTVSASGNTTQQAYAFTNSAGTPINCAQPTVVGGKTRIVTTWTYPLGLSSGTTNGSLSVYLNGQKIPRFVSSTLTPDASYTEVATNIIDLDTNYSTLSLPIEIKYDTSVIDATATSSTAITQLQNLSRDGFQAFVQETSLTAINGTPSTGQFRSTITGRANIPDISNNLKVHMGPDRIMTQQIVQLQNEFGPNGEPVFSAVNDDKGLIRFVGAWIQGNNAVGQYTQTLNATDYVEITFYGTGLNVLALGSGATIASYSLNGGTTTQFLNATVSAVLSNRNYSSNQPINVVSGLTLGIYVIKITIPTNAASIGWSGFEVLNESTTLKVNPGSAYIEGQKVTLANLASPAYNSTFESGTLGTRGGRVLTYLKNDGTIAKAVSPVNAASATLTSADHTNEEIVRTYNFREFGAGRSDDFSLLAGTANSARAFTLDDGTTSLTAAGASIFVYNQEGYYLTNANDSTVFTFIGTGVDLLHVHNATLTGVYSIFIDGVSIATGLTGTVMGTSKYNNYKIASGLPYGTHTVKILQTASSTNLTISGWRVYQPKKPTLPTGAIELADYNVMATYVANTTASANSIGQGVLKKSCTREVTYVGTGWAVAGPHSLATTGWDIETNVSGDYAEYTFFGTGVDFRFYGLSANGTTAATMTIDGSSNLSGYTTSSYGATSFTPSTGVFSQTTTNGGAGISISGLTLGLHKIRVTNNSTTYLRIDSFDIITPIHSAKSNLNFDVQNTLSVGSNAISDNRTFNPIKNVALQPKAGAQAVGISGSPTSTSTAYIPCPDLSVTLKTNGGGLLVTAFVQMNCSVTGSAPGIALYIDGIQINGSGVYFTAANTNYDQLLSITQIVPLSPGVHKIDIYWATSSGTITAKDARRVLTVKET